ncbi:MAG: flagella synthesis protein FlgN [Gammaproteobacteria bacterium]
MAIQNTYQIAAKLLRKGIDLTRRLHELLIDEAEILRCGKDAERLMELSMQKEAAVSELSQFTRHLSQLLEGENLTLSEKGVEKFIEKVAFAKIDVTEITMAWEELRALSENCRLLNDQNGAGIELLTRHIHRSIQILNGEPQLGCTYGPNGTKSIGLFSHSLASV